MNGPRGQARYVMIDVLHSGRGLWVAAIVFGAARGSLPLWFSGGVVGAVPCPDLVLERIST